MRWFNLNTGKIILVIIIILFAIGIGIVGYSLWNVPEAKELFPFLEISEAFPIKAIALFTGLATFGTLLLALATIVTIKNNNEQEKRRREEELAKEKRDKKERLLNEIIEWAIDVGKCGKRADLSDLLHIAADKQESFLPIRMTEAALNIGLIEGRNEYISTTALNFGQELQEDVDRLIDCLEAYRELLAAESKGVPTAPESIEKVESHDRQLLTLASNVIKKAVKIKTRDIS